jgi:hypothetical protein
VHRKGCAGLGWPRQWTWSRARRGSGALALVSAVTLLGLLAGIAAAEVNPPRPADTATVRIQPDIPGEAYISNTLIVARAALKVGPAISLQALQSQVKISRTSSRIVVISAPATAEATRAVVAVAQSYVAYVNGKDAPDQNGKMHAAVLYVSSVTPRMSLFSEVLDTGGLGALCGALFGAVGAAALSFPSRRSGRHKAGLSLCPAAAHPPVPRSALPVTRHRRCLPRLPPQLVS